MKIYLIGMPGSGKSTLGQALADRLSLPFVDLDQEIEKKASASVSDIFASKGEDYFRILESETLTEWASKKDDFILATGGGSPCFYNGIDTMNITGLTIFLNVPIAELTARMATKTDRPLLHNESGEDLRMRLTILAEERMGIYTQAAIIVNNPTLDSILLKLQSRR
jgi:shikimate kinase